MGYHNAVKSSNLNIHLLIGFLLLMLIAESISALIPAPPSPLADELLGHLQCPSGSFCIETNYCTKEYFTTKSGLPFYCGPRHQIDSMICCVKLEAEAVTNMYSSETQEIYHTDEGMSNEIYSGGRTNRSVEDDEVEILAMPYSTNQIDEHEVPIADMETVLDGHFDSWGDDLESLIEDAIEHENLKQHIRETEPALNDFLDEQREYIFPSNNMKDPLPVYVASRGQAGPQINKQFEEPLDSHARESRQFSTLERPPMNMNNCPCEKGERGEPGPKGEPGEPGKIVYIPVFVNAPGYYPMISPGNNNAALAGAPLSFNPPIIPNQPNLQTYYGQSNAAVPQHPNPTVIPYNVPINLVPAIPTQIQQQPQLAPQYYAQNPQQQPSSAPQADSMEARQTRHTITDPRLANRRY